jgi:hypothetical protein
MFTARVLSGRHAAAVGAAVLTLALAACGSDSGSASYAKPVKPGMARTATPPMSSMPSMPSMRGMRPGNGLAASSGGYRLTAESTTLPAKRPVDYRFTITGPDGKPLTAFVIDQTKRMHFYAIRSDLTGFQHVHPAMAADGTWTARLSALPPGSWRFFTSFVPGSGPGEGTGLVLSRTATVPGAVATTELPAASSTTTVDGYTVTVHGELMAGMAHPFTITIGKDGEPITDLQPYLGSYAHLTAFHAGDAAFAHLHPETKVTGGPTLAFHAEFGEAGSWRLFLQFKTAGALHTAALTLHVS